MRILMGLLLAVLVVGCGGTNPSAELAEARDLFQRNLDSIKNKDREAYLSCYWPNESFTRNGPEGPLTGYSEWAQGLGDNWPEVFDAKNMQLTWIQPGVVYGSYRYRVRFVGAEEDAVGVSERVMIKTDEGWKISVSTSFPAPDGTPAPALSIVNVRYMSSLFNKDDTVSDARSGPIVLADGVIQCLGDTCSTGGTETINGGGLFVIGSVPEVHSWLRGGRRGERPGFGLEHLTIRPGMEANLLLIEVSPGEVEELPFESVRYVIHKGEIRSIAEYGIQ